MIGLKYFAFIYCCCLSPTGTNDVIDLRTSDADDVDRSLIHTSQTFARRKKFFQAKFPPILSSDDYDDGTADFNDVGKHWERRRHTRNLQHFKSSSFERKEIAINYPINFATAAAFLVTRIKINSTFSIYFQIKTTQMDGLVMYIRKDNSPFFISVELCQGHIRYVFDIGGGQRVLEDRLQQQHIVSDGRWHEVSVQRPSVTHNILRVDDITSSDIFQLEPRKMADFDVGDELYIGGVPGFMYGTLPDKVISPDGFLGCISSVDLDGNTWAMLEEQVEIREEFQQQQAITEGCDGSATSLQEKAPIDGDCFCENGGVCMPRGSIVTCDCNMTSFTGLTCSDDSIAYTFGQDGVIAYTFPLADRQDTTLDQLSLGFSTSQSNATLVRITSDTSKDYIEMHIMNGLVNVTYNVGKSNITISERSRLVNDGNYHVARFVRNGPNSTLKLDDLPHQTKTPLGLQMTIFNQQSLVVVGGRRDKTGRYNNEFQGTISGLVFNSLWILDMVARGEKEAQVIGGMELEIKPLRPLYSLTAISSWESSILPPPAEEIQTKQHTSLYGKIIKASVDDFIQTVPQEVLCQEVMDGDVACIRSLIDPSDAFIHPSVKTTRLTTTTMITTTTTTTTTKPTSSTTVGKTECVPGKGSCHRATAPVPGPVVQSSSSTRTTASTPSTTTPPRPAVTQPPSTIHRPKSSIPSMQAPWTDGAPLETSTYFPITKSTLRSVEIETIRPPRKPEVIDGDDQRTTTTAESPIIVRATYVPFGPSLDRDVSRGKPDVTYEEDPDDDDVKTRQRPTSLMSMTTNIALTIGTACGTIVLLIVTIYALWRCRYNSNETPKYCKPEQPASKYVYEACETRPATPCEKVSFINNDRQKRREKYVNEWYV